MNRMSQLTARTVILAAVLAAVTGCGATATGLGQITVRNVAGVKAAATLQKSAVKPAAVVGASAKTSSLVAASQASHVALAASLPVGNPPSANVVNQMAAAGMVRVGFASTARARSLMSISDIASVKVVLTSVDGSSQSQSLTAAALAAANPGVAFGGVPSGNATLAVTALDAAGTALGQSSASTLVAAGHVSQVALTVHIAATGSVAANVNFVEDNATPAATAAPVIAAVPAATPSPSNTPAPADTPTPAPADTPTPAASIPAFLAASATPAPSATGTTDVWGRLYDVNVVQQMTGSVRFVSADGTYDSTVALRADGYFYLPAVPTGVTVAVTASSGALAGQTSSTFAPAVAGGSAWLDLFVQ